MRRDLLLITYFVKPSAESNLGIAHKIHYGSLQIKDKYRYRIVLKMVSSFILFLMRKKLYFELKVGDFWEFRFRSREEDELERLVEEEKLRHLERIRVMQEEEEKAKMAKMKTQSSLLNVSSRNFQF